jgi:hypothetical protein
MRSAPLIFPANIPPANFQQISHLTIYYFDFVTKSEQAGKMGNWRIGHLRGPTEAAAYFAVSERCEFVTLDIFVSNARTEASTLYQPTMESGLFS